MTELLIKVVHYSFEFFKYLIMLKILKGRISGANIKDSRIVHEAFVISRILYFEQGKLNKQLSLKDVLAVVLLLFSQQCQEINGA